MAEATLFPVKVISLARSRERRARFSTVNSHLKFEFVDAIDGATLTEAQLEDPRHFIHPLLFPSMGAYGCALSHLKLWEEAIATSAPVTIAEDDAVFRLDFEKSSREVMSRLPEDWDLVLWGWNFDSVVSLMSLAGVAPAVLKFDQDLLRENMDTFQASTEPSYPLGLDRSCGTPGYTISPAGARKFKDDCFPMKAFQIYFPVMNRNLANTGIDIAMARAYSVTRSFIAFPPLVATRNERDASTVQPPAPR